MVSHHAESAKCAILESISSWLNSPIHGTLSPLLCDGMVITLEVNAATVGLLHPSADKPTDLQPIDICVTFSDGGDDSTTPCEGQSSAASMPNNSLLSTLGSWVGNWLPTAVTTPAPLAEARSTGSPRRAPGIAARQVAPKYLELTGEEQLQFLKEDLVVEPVLDAFAPVGLPPRSTRHQLSDLAGADQDLKRIFSLLLPIIAPEARYQSVVHRCTLEPALIISGAAGSGKTVIASAVASYVTNEATLGIWTEWISCKYVHI